MSKARRWSSARPLRQAGVVLTGLLVLIGLGWAWWPAGQYRPVRSNERGTVGSILSGLASPASVVRPRKAAPVTSLASGHYLAPAMIPVGGSSPADPAMFFVSGSEGGAPVAVVSARTGSTRHDLGASAFPFVLSPAPGPGDTQAVALGTRDHGVTYRIAFAVLTVRGGQPVTASNQAFALADCDGCTTVAVSFQVVLVVGHSAVLAPLDTAVAANRGCPACATTAIADQLVATVDARPPASLERALDATLAPLDLLPELDDHTPEVNDDVPLVHHDDVPLELDDHDDSHHQHHHHDGPQHHDDVRSLTSSPRCGWRAWPPELTARPATLRSLDGYNRDDTEIRGSTPGKRP